jgi:hypothetical protein
MHPSPEKALMRSWWIKIELYHLRRFGMNQNVRLDAMFGVMDERGTNLDRLFHHEISTDG